MNTIRQNDYDTVSRQRYERIQKNAMLEEQKLLNKIFKQFIIVYIVCWFITISVIVYNHI